MLEYVLITPARNEAENIERTIQSMIRQSVHPQKWVIVSDGSTDETDQIVQRYVPTHPWIELLQRPPRPQRHFGGKADAFNSGYARVRSLEFDVIGNLDADLSFREDLFEFLLQKFAENPKLGVAGAPFRENGEQYDYRYTSVEHVSGACQLFRRQCFEQIGGYIPIKEGGIDLVAVTTARMRGWETRTFLERSYEHHRKTQVGKHSDFRARFKSGYHDYLMGVHPLWQFCRSFYQGAKKPVLVGGFLLFAGYAYALARRAPRPVSDELVAFRRKEQMRRLRERFLGKAPPPAVVTGAQS